MLEVGALTTITPFWVAALNVRYRDVGHLLGLGLLVWFWLTPIVYPIGIIPSSFQWLVRLNPMTHITGAYQEGVRPGHDWRNQQRIYAVLHIFDDSGHHTGSNLRFTGSGSLVFTGGEDDPADQAGVRDGLREVSVRDRGRGFDMRYSSKLFEPFQRLHSPEEGAGSGIGLAIARRVAERHGGSIRAESAPGAGSTFHVSLPAAEAPDEHAP